MPEVPEALRAAVGDRYRLERELGRGGMAVVYLATDLKHERQIALKVLNPELAAAVGSERFLREITLMAGLHHPHILPLLDSGEADGFLYYTMPWVTGESLRDRLAREKQLPVEQALRITREVTDALEYAHHQGIIHRDIKPENILLEGGHAVVADFGIARAVTASGGQKLTDTGIAVGTPGYMSPEQATATKQLDGRTDIYSLGCVLYEMLVGEVPFTGPSAQAILARKLNEPLPSISVVREAVVPGLEAAIRTALARTAADRFQTVGEFRAALEPAALAAYRPVTPAPAGRRGRSIAVALVVVAALVTTAVWRARAKQAAGALDPRLIAALPFRAATGDSALRVFAEQVPARWWTMVTGQFGPRAADYGATERLWRDGGGTPEGGLPEDEERTIARRLGAGLLVRGVVSGSSEAMTIAASLEQVADGHVVVPVQTVSGPATRMDRLMDSLVVLVLAPTFGADVKEIPQLSKHPPRAVQAYLAGMQAGYQGPSSFGRAGQLLDEALQADSSLVEAAKWKYTFGEEDVQAGRYAWAHRDQLSPRDQAVLKALVGNVVGVLASTGDRIAAWEAVTREWPEYAGGWTELGATLAFAAPLIRPDWRAPATAALHHAVRLNPGIQFAWMQLWELAFLNGDSAEIVGDLDSMVARGDSQSTSAPQRWRVALWLGDTAAAARAFTPTGDIDIQNRPAWAHYLMFALEDGRGVADADRAAALKLPYANNQLQYVWARARGRHAEYLQWRDGPSPVFPHPLISARSRLQSALLLGEAEDSTIQLAARQMVEMARSDAPFAPAARCWSAVWASAHGDSAGVREATPAMETSSGYPMCAALTEVLLARVSHGDLGPSLHRLDSLSRAGLRVPDLDRWTVNLFLARLLPMVGDTTGALAAARRRTYVYSMYGFSSAAAELVIDYLREEGRLAAATGDTTGAISAYSHYLALRQEPDWEPWRAEREQVKRELSALVSERPGRLTAGIPAHPAGLAASANAEPARQHRRARGET